MIHYNAPAIKHIEDEINIVFDEYKSEDYTQCECLLRARKYFLNNQALAHQAELLPDIIAFNDALTDALQQMYDRALEVYKQVSAISPELELEAKYFLSYNYSPLHPYQAEDRQELWDALQDSGWNPLYDDGIGFALSLPNRDNESFESFIGLDCPPPNWNEGLDPELTKDLHLIQQFHHLFDHTNFALTDFIFVRDFNIEINICFEEDVLTNVF